MDPDTLSAARTAALFNLQEREQSIFVDMYQALTQVEMFHQRTPIETLATEFGSALVDEASRYNDVQTG
jgi:hypothetical protein